MENEFQIYSLATSCAMIFIFSLFLISLWAVVITHYKHKYHPLVTKRFDVIFKGIRKDSKNFIVNGALPLYITKRFMGAIVLAVLCNSTLGPILILGFLQLAVKLTKII